MDAARDGARGDEGETTSTAFLVKARRVEGADVGPVVLEDENATVADLKRALLDVPWLARETSDGAIGDGDEATSPKPASTAYLRVLLDGKMLEPDTKALKWCGFVSGEVRIAHLIVSENASTLVETRKRASEANKDASATQPTCCSVM